jgi:hypothetical protein
LAADFRLQEVYAASHFPPQPIVITEIRFRRDSLQAPFSATIPNLQLNLSTTTKAPDTLSGVFASNIGNDDTIVFSGTLTINSSGSGPPGGPNPFDIVVPLSTPFSYDPAAGNLLVDVRNFSGITVSFVDQSNDSNDSASRVFGPGANAATANFSDTGADVLRLAFTTINSSPAISSINDIAIVENTLTAALGFVVSDAETAASALILSASSSNTTLVPNSNITLGGSGANRNITVTPALNQFGVTTISLTVSDPNGGTSSTSFVLTVLADSDGDGIPDTFEIANGLDKNDPTDAAIDLDGDGFSNLQEFLLGTNPRSPASSFEITDTKPNGTDVQISLNSVAGKNYRVERSDTSPAGPWTTVADVVGNGGTLQVTDVGGAAQAKRFYRIVLLP